MKTQYETILNFLNKGHRLTERQAQSWGITNLSARVAELRAQGHSIYTNTRKSVGSFYKLGKPSRSMIAASYAIAGSTLFGSK